MQASDFQTSIAGRVVTAPQGYIAFVPAPLPPTIIYTPALVRAISEADAALSELSGTGRLLPNPHVLIAPYVRREAVLSSRIEGTQASLTDLLEAEAGLTPPNTPHSPPDDVREVRNYIAALEHGMSLLGELPLSLRLVREVHAKLLDGVRGNTATPGEFRRSQNWIGPPGSTPTTVPYVPPPVLEMNAALGEWEKFLHWRGEMPDLVQCALIHEHFEAIHPFLDGNGRVGRLLIMLFLIDRGRLSQPLLYLSEFIERHRREYYESLSRIRTHGDWQGWLMYFLNGVRWSAARASRQAKQLLDLREQLRATLEALPKALPLVDVLFTNPYVNPPRLQKLLGISDPTARVMIAKLETLGVLREVTGRAWGKLWLAATVLKAIEEPGEEPVEPNPASPVRDEQ